MPLAHSSLKPRLASGVALFLALLLAWLVFSPGIGGDFIFDDYANLSGLHVAQGEGLVSLARYVFDDITGSLGRPVSLLSFALQAHSWPGHPEDFIRVNILIHLLNGVLLSWALLLLLRLARFPGPEALSVCAAAVWMVSPLQAGAVLYVVQRMAVLSGTCVLAGLVLYLAGRQRVLEQRSASGLLLMTAGVGVGLGLGVLAKENAVLFPLLVLVAEFTLLYAVERNRTWRRWAAACLAAPLALFTAYLLWRLPGDLQATTQSGYTSPERMLSQPRVLLMYLQKTVLPSLYGIRIMYDDLPASTSLLSPWTTLPSWIACIGLLTVAFVKRRALPLLSFAILWFFAAHSLESSFIPLELAFDHRNYIALVAPALLLVATAAHLIARPEVRRIRGAVAVAMVAYFLSFLVAQWHTARLWANPYELRAYWHQAQPDSRRVTFELADAHFRHGHADAALAVRERAFQRWPGDTRNLLSILSIGCAFEDKRMPDLSVLKYSVERFDGHPTSTLSNYNRIVLQFEAGLCTRYPMKFLLDALDVIYEVPTIRNRRFAYHTFRARLFHAVGSTTEALDEFERAIALRPTPYAYEVAVRWSIDAGDLARARKLLSAAESPSVGESILRTSYADTYRQFRRELDALESAAGATAPLESR